MDLGWIRTTVCISFSIREFDLMFIELSIAVQIASCGYGIFAESRTQPIDALRVNVCCVLVCYDRSDGVHLGHGDLSSEKRILHISQ